MPCGPGRPPQPQQRQPCSTSRESESSVFRLREVRPLHATRRARTLRRVSVWDRRGPMLRQLLHLGATSPEGLLIRRVGNGVGSLSATRHWRIPARKSSFGSGCSAAPRRVAGHGTATGRDPLGRRDGSGRGEATPVGVGSSSHARVGKACGSARGWQTVWVVRKAKVAAPPAVTSFGTI